jgi:membrane fusion protein, heavy metal efflux system
MNEAKDNAVHPEAQARLRPRPALFVAAGLALVALLGLFFWTRDSRPATKEQPAAAKKDDPGKEGEEHKEGSAVELEAEALKAAGIETAEVTEREAGALLRVTGTVETNQQQTQQVTPLVAGRVERVNVALGDRVRAGTVIAVVSSPEAAEMHGKLHEAETRLRLAEQNLARVQQAENRVAVLQAKSKLDEAEATLRRTRRLIELGAGAGKDLIAAEAEQQRAKADYEFQSNISLNREVQQARSEVETARTEVTHYRNSLRAIGAAVSEEGHDKAPHDTSTIALRAPVSGTVTERMVNAGAGIEVGKPIFTIANISTLWVIANVPEAQIGRLRVDTPAEVRSAALGDGAISGRVNYIDPNLNEESRMARVRVEVANRQERLKVGMFVEVGFQGAGLAPGATAESALVIPEAAIQRVAERTVVFLPEEGKEGHFEARDIEVGGAQDGFTRVISGLKAGERVVTKGSFTLKTMLLKGEMGEHGH